MRRTTALLTTLGILLVAATALAQVTVNKPKLLAVSAADVAQAGFTHVQPIAPTADGRWKSANYFTVDQTISSDAAKHDCADCGNVVAAYAAVSPTIPGWSINQRVFIQKIGARWQGRAYLPNTKTVIEVTGPDQTMIGKLLDGLKTKFGA